MAKYDLPPIYLFNQGLGQDWTAAEVSKSSNERKLDPARCLASSINAPSPDQEKSTRLLGHSVRKKDYS